MQKALDYYQDIHKRFPDNIDCLKFLVRIYTDRGLTEKVQKYTELLTKAENLIETKKQVTVYNLMIYWNIL